MDDFCSNNYPVSSRVSTIIVVVVTGEYQSGKTDDYTQPPDDHSDGEHLHVAVRLQLAANACYIV